MLIGKNWVFVHNPKTGGTSMRKALRPFATEERKTHGPLWPQGPGLASQPVRIAAVRNPFDRMVSAYHFIYRNKEERPEFNEWLLSPEPCQINSFDIKRQLQLLWTHQCNYIIQFEHLQSQWDELITKHLKIDAPLGHHNKSERPSTYRDYYTKKSIEVMNDRFGPDLKRWWYEF